MDIKKTLSEMTLQEKAKLVSGATFCQTASIDRLGVPSLQMLDGATGINYEQLFADILSEKRIKESNGSVERSAKTLVSTALTNVRKHYFEPELLNKEEKKLYGIIHEELLRRTGEEYAPACYPSGMLLGASFHPYTVNKVAKTLAKEAKVFGIDILYGTPNANILRNPLAGRLFEGFSEDPYHLSVLAPEFCKGVQSQGIAANVKHFVAYNQEANRQSMNEVIAQRALEEIYYPSFKSCIQKGKVRTLMSAYPKINGVRCSENEKLLKDTLRSNWGFTGVIISDYGSVVNPIDALKATVDINMPGPVEEKTIVEAVENGVLSMEVLDKTVKRILKLNDYCKCPTAKTDISKLQATSTKVAYEAAIEGMVLLKNDAKTLPIDKKQGNLLIITGTGAEDYTMCGYGSAGISTDRKTSFPRAMAKNFGEDKIEIVTIDNLDVLEDSYVDDRYRHIRQTIASNKDAHIIYVADIAGGEGNDRKDMLLSRADRELLWKLCEHKTHLLNEQRAGVIDEDGIFKLTLVLNVCGPVSIGPFEESLDAVLVTFHPGMEGGRALADILSGKRNPSGKLPITFPKRIEDAPTYVNSFGDGNEIVYGEGIFVGYRYYEKKQVEPAYHFGYGLSYTEFVVNDVNVRGDRRINTKKELEVVPFQNDIQITVHIQNKGPREGSEVLQVYVADEYSTLNKPIKELKAFQKVFLKAGEEKIVTFNLSKKDFASYDSELASWIAEEGYYRIIIANSSAKSGEIAVKRIYLDTKSPYSYGLDSKVKVFYENEELRNILNKFFDDNGFDREIFNNAYEYTPGNPVISIMPKKLDLAGEKVRELVERIEQVKKL